jgi:hypothetical protein
MEQLFGLYEAAASVAKMGWKEVDLPGLPKGDKSKEALARRLQQERVSQNFIVGGRF